MHLRNLFTGIWLKNPHESSPTKERRFFQHGPRDMPKGSGITAAIFVQNVHVHAMPTYACTSVFTFEKQFAMLHEHPWNARK